MDSAANAAVHTPEDFPKIVTVAAGRKLDDHVIDRWWQQYQEEIDNPSPAGLGTVLTDGGSELGTGYGKVSLWMEDTYFQAGRRYANQVWADRGVPSYNFLFGVVTEGMRPEIEGAAHFQEIPYVFGNEAAYGWETDPFPKDPELRAKHIEIVRAMSRMWISFVVSGSPNNHKCQLLLHSSLGVISGDT